MSTEPAPQTAPTKGKRYSDALKAEVLRFIDDVNSRKGRGGKQAAARKYGVPYMTSTRWIRDARHASNGVPSELSEKIALLGSLHGQIAIAEKRLVKLQAKFAELKSSL